MAGTDSRSGARLAELIAALSLGTDLGLGQRMEHVLRQCLIALRLGERFGLDESERAVLYYVALLAWVGCHADSYEQARWFGDDIATRADTYAADLTGMRTTSFALRHLGAGRSPCAACARRSSSSPPAATRSRPSMRPIASSRASWPSDSAWASPCVTRCSRPSSAGTARAIQPGSRVRRSDCRSASSSSRTSPRSSIARRGWRRPWRSPGSGAPRSSIPGSSSASARKPSSSSAPLDVATSWDDVIDAEPGLRKALSDEELDAALEAIADFADLKSPYTLGHSRGVAELAADGGRNLGLPNGETAALRRAGLLHDLGRLGISNAIWDKRAPLTPAELERIRLHPYLTERMLSSSRALAPLGALAAQHHERLDGSGYPRGLGGNMLPPAARVLAAADVYHAVTEPRPHRPARSAEEAAGELRAEVRAGRLDGEAVDAVLRAGGHQVTRRREA